MKFSSLKAALFSMAAFFINIALAALCLQGCHNGIEETVKKLPQADTLRMQETIQVLCDPVFQGRKAGKMTDNTIALYLGSKMLDAGFSPYFSNTSLMAVQTAKLKTFNSVVRFDVANPIGTILIGAHYDHLGFGGKGSGSLVPDSIAIHYGADDNASGVAMGMEVARLLANSSKKLRYNIVFSALAAEEAGLIGSKFLADSLQVLGESPQLMINLDMVGRLRSDSLLQISGTGTFAQADSLLNLMDSLPQGLPLRIKRSPGGFGPSDYSSFYRTKVPVLALSTGAHTDYHTPGDTPDKLNYKGMAEIANYLVAFVHLLSQEEVLPTYLETNQEDSQHKASFKVSLGVIPDLAYDGEGFCAGTVIHGRPSFLAGMKDGDVVVQMDHTPIHNIDEYMAFLGTLQKGQLISIMVLREGKYLSLDVQL